MADGVLQLQCECKHDAWGKKGNESLAGRLWSQMPGASPLDDSETYSEILSFAKALPLQLHPDKKLAEQLHERDPIKFGDANHKPEIAVALTRFELFVGFKPIGELADILKLGPLQAILPQHDIVNEAILREVCRTLLQLSSNTVSDVVKNLKAIPQSELGERNQYIPNLLERLSEQYSNSDNGLLVASLLMNFMTLEPGQAVCVPADSIHAWLSGDILECMARSDNVLNTGFCPRASRDNIELFTSALTFKPHDQEAALLPARPSLMGINEKTVKYTPPFSEFNVLATSLAAKESETHTDLQAPSILVVTGGSGTMKVLGDSKILDLGEGSVFFAGPEAKLQFATDNGISIYRAYATL
ncbi:unnamed protein product [Penicillium pancosmium]